MCGFVVAIGTNDIDNAIYRIRHRGLDSSKIWRANNISIGFNRLSINDKSEEGMQPFEYEELIGAFNGEIYNADLLKRNFGIVTKSESDTEIILPLFKKLGVSIIHHLDGFYSGIIYNIRTGHFFLLRDYIGKKPLFGAKRGNAIYITSELKALDNINSFQIIPKGFSQLSNGEIHIMESHKIPFAPKSAIKQTIIEAVKKRIPRNEEKFGVFVSGGLDSSIISSIVNQYADNAIYYTLGNNYDMEYVKLLSESMPIKIKRVDLPNDSEMLNLIEKIVYHTESYNPSIISNGLATYLLSREAHNDGVKVVLSGEGADELFCGYPISNNENTWFNKRTELIENLHFTELRRLDMASMANTIEIRCPFLDRQVFSISNNCNISDLISNSQGKQILRNAFKEDLPKEIVHRDKMSFDVGSGIRELTVEHLTINGQTEKDALLNIWEKLFPLFQKDNPYFYSYPTFDNAIAKREAIHKSVTIEKIQKLLKKEFETIPFHTLFMLNNKKIFASNFGGTCSDKTLHFQKVLADNGIKSELHSAYINDVECHRMLSVEISNNRYFIDVGSGWPCIKLFPADKPTEYSAYGMTFKTELDGNTMILYRKTGNNDFKIMITIPLHGKQKNEILKDIENRFDGNLLYPFKNHLRFSQVIEDTFYFLKDNRLKCYNTNEVTEHILSEKEIITFLQDKCKFNMKNLDIPRTGENDIDISVIIATKNRSSYLKRSLFSIENQTLKPTRTIIVDDSDSQQYRDQNIEIIESFKQKAQEIQVHYITNQRTLGASGSWNSAIDLLLLRKISPENSYIAILDDDDEWLPNYLKCCAMHIKDAKYKLDMVASDFYRITDSHKEINSAPANLYAGDFLVGNPGIQGSNLFIRLSCFLEAGCFDENLKSCTDRDLCIRISDLGYIKYEHIAQPLMKHYAESNRNRLSTPNTEQKNEGLYYFWLKHSKRMSAKQKLSFQQRAKKLFKWEFCEKETSANTLVQTVPVDEIIKYPLWIGTICSDFNVIQPLLKQLDSLQTESFIETIRLFILENNLSKEGKGKISAFLEKTHIHCTFLTMQMQDIWMKEGYFNNFYRNKTGLFSIAQARTMLQKYIGQSMRNNKDAVVWIIDEDMQIEENTIKGLKILPQLRDKGIDIVLGKYEYSSPNPPINGIRTQLVDLWNNLCWMTNQNTNEVLMDFSDENQRMMKKYPDYYYDLSRKHTAHLEHPFWLTPMSKKETYNEALDRICQNAVKIFAGIPLTRPLVVLQNKSLVDSVKDSVNRGGITFVFNYKALYETPNLNIKVHGSDIRRSDMIWAVINKYYRKMTIKIADIPVWHAGKSVSSYTHLDIDKLREEILGSVLYATLTDFLKENPNHELCFTDKEICKITKMFEKLMEQRMLFLKLNLYRIKGISKCITNSDFYKTNNYMKDLTATIEKVFSNTNYSMIEQSIKSFCPSIIGESLKSIRNQAENYKNTILQMNCCK